MGIATRISRLVGPRPLRKLLARFGRARRGSLPITGSEPRIAMASDRLTLRTPASSSPRPAPPVSLPPPAPVPLPPPQPTAREVALKTAKELANRQSAATALSAAFEESTTVPQVLEILRLAKEKGFSGLEDSAMKKAWILAGTKADFVAIARTAHDTGWMGYAERAVTRALEFDATLPPDILVKEALALARQFKDLGPVNAGLSVAFRQARTQEHFLAILETAHSRGQYSFQDRAIHRAWDLSRTRDEWLRLALVADRTGWTGMAASAIRMAFPGN